MRGAPLDSLLRELSPLNPRPKTDMPAGDTTITGVHHDSRRVTPGGVFVCLPGLTRDGHEFASRARESGAALVIGERESIPNVPYLQVDDGRKALALLAASWYGHPSHRVQAIGITGTNGKSSVTWMIVSICRAAGKSSSPSNRSSSHCGIDAPH